MTRHPRDKVHRGVLTLTRKERHFVHKFVLDGLATYIYFVPLVIIVNTSTSFFGLPSWDLETVVTYMGTSLIVAFLFGGVFGRVINSWRKKLNYH